MASKQGSVHKTYELRTLGYQDLSKQLDNVAKKFEAIKKAKLSASEKLLSAQDTNDLKKYSDELAKLTVQEKELKVQRLQMINDQKAANLLRQEAIRQQKQEAAGASVVAGSYNDILRQQKQLYALVKNTKTGSPVTFQGQTLQFDQAIAKLKQLSAAEQDFRRQFARDGLLVAEYASGIRQGLGGIGDIGNKATTSLSNGFKQLKGQMAQFVLGFIGAQAALSAIQKSFSDTVRIDSLESALRSVSQTEEEFNVNSKFLEATVSRLGLELIDTSVAFKNFYAASTQAGLSADQTRDIFSAAAEASAVLKLSQQDTNGVLLAFGQIASKGKVQAEELRGQIGERVPGAFSIAARAIGVTQQELNKMLERGEVISTEFLPKFAAELKRTFGTDATKNVEGLQASINRLKNRFTELLQSNKSGLTNFFSFLINGAGILIKLLPLVVVALALYTAEAVRAYVATQLATKGTILWNLALLAQQAYTKAAGIFLYAYYGTIALTTGALTKSTAATRLFSNALKAIPLGAVLTVIGLVAGAIAVFARSVTNSTKALGEYALKQLAINNINQQAIRISSKQIGELNGLAAVVRSTATSFDTKKKAVEELIKKDQEFSSVIKNNIVDLNELERALGKVTTAIKLKAQAEASASLTAEKQASVNEIAIIRQRLESEFARQNTKGIVKIDGLTKSEQGILSGGFFGSDFTKAAPSLRVGRSQAIFLAEEFNNLIDALKEEENKRINVLESYQQFQEKANKELESFIAGKTSEASKFEIDIKNLKDQIDKLDKEIDSFQGTKKDLDKKIAARKKLQDQLDSLLGNKSTNNRASSLTGIQKDQLKDIDAVRDKLLSDNEKARIESAIDEEKYLNNLYQINLSAIRKKLGLLTGANAEERKQRSQLQLEEVKLEKETNQKVYDIKEKALNDQYDLEVSKIKETEQDILNNANSTDIDKAQAQLNADIAELAAKEKYYAELLKLDQNYSQEVLKKAKEGIAAINLEITKDRQQVTAETIADIEKRGNAEIQAEQIKFAKIRNAILSNQKITATKRKKQLEDLQKAEERTILAIELKTLQAQLRVIETLYGFSLLSEQEFLKAQQKLIEKSNEILGKLNANTDEANEKLRKKFTDIKSLIQSGLRDLFNVDEGSEEDQALGEIIAQSYSLAFDAMSSFFGAERARIQENLDLQLQRLDLEKEQVQARAQSQAEIDSIEKQYAAKKKKAEQEAGEKLKKTRKSEAKIALATELANIAVQASAYPFPGSLIIGGILSALALGRYALRIGEINREKFEKGGVPTKTGGPIKGPSHAKGGVPFNYEAEGKELAIINKKSAGDRKVRTVTGTNMQIASLINEFGGGKKFASGAKLVKFESGGYLGDNLQAPIFSPANNNFITTGNNTDIIKAINEQSETFKELADEQSKRIDRLQVSVSEKSITKTQKKVIKQSEINSL